MDFPSSCLFSFPGFQVPAVHNGTTKIPVMLGHGRQAHHGGGCLLALFQNWEQRPVVPDHASLGSSFDVEY